MIETMKDTETLNAYDRACLDCIDDLYRAAYLVFADPGTAENLVTKVCIAGVHRYDAMTDRDVIRLRLAADLYRMCRRRLGLCTLLEHPAVLRGLNKRERLLVLMWYASRMPAAEFCEAAGAEEALLSHALAKLTDRTGKTE
ncbi:MAG: hypothetical protein IJ037_11690 [Clostridia bacterium]|nr:hypothetical protein [Clostridia bacterium]